MADRSVKVVLGASVGGFQAGMRTAKGAVEDFTKSAGKSFEKNRAQLDQISSTATKVGLGLTALAGFAVKSAMDWEVAWTGVLKTVDGTSAQLGVLEEDLRSLAKETGFAHREVAAVAEAAGQLGISTPGVAAFTETMLAMGVSTNLGAEEAATGLARFRNIMGSTEADIEKMGSTIVGLGNNFATTEAEILAMSLRLAGAGRQAGLTEADVMGMATAMSSVGIEAEAGGTAMSLTMKRIGREVDSGGDKLDLFARIAGTSAEDFRRAWQDDAAGTLATFIAGLDRASESGESVNAVLTELGVTGIREADALLRLSGNYEGLADALEMAGEEWARNNALMAEADKFYNTTAQKGKQAWASIKDSAIDAGDALLPVVAEIFEAVGGVAGAFGSLPGPVKSGLTAVAGVTGVTALAVGGLIKLATAIQDTKAAYDGLTLGGGKAKGMIAGFGRAALVGAAVVGTYAVLENAAKRSSGEVDALGKELSEFGKTGKTGTDLNDVFGEGLGGRSRRFSRDLRSIGEAVQEFRKYGDDNMLTQAWRRVSGTVTGGGFVGSLTATEPIYNSVKAIKDMDAALIGLSRNKPEDAIAAFERLRDTAVEQGASLEDLEHAFPAMTEILRGASQQLGGSADSAEVLSGNLEDLAPAAQVAAEDLAAARDEAYQLGAAFLDAGEALDGTMADWGAQLREQTEALRDFRKNAAEALRKGADETLVDYLMSQGPAGAAMLKQLAEGSKDAADAISKDWQGSQEELARFVAFRAELDDWTIVTEFKTAGAEGAIETAAEVADAANMTPEQVETVLTALDYSTADIKAVLARLRELDAAKAEPTINAQDNATVVIDGVLSKLHRLSDGTTIPIRINMPGQIPSMNDIYAPRLATGGPVAGPGTGTSDSIPALLSNGEHVWTAREVKAVGGQGAMYGLRAAAMAGMLPRFADGGAVEAVSAREYTQLRIRVRDLQRALRETETFGKDKRKRYVLRGLDRREARQDLREARAELAEQREIRSNIGKGKKYRTAGAYNRALAAGEERADTAASFADGLDASSFRSAATLERSLGNMLRDSAEFTIVLAELRKKGASPWLLDQLVKAGPSRATNRTARALLADTDRLRRLNALSSGITSTANTYAGLVTGRGFTPTFSGVATGGVVNLAPESIEQLVRGVVTGSREMSTRVYDANEYITSGGTRFPSPVAGVWK